MNEETCPMCGRPKYTEADLARWKSEVGDDFRAPEADWSRRLCWTKRELQHQCLMKPIANTKETK